jgi:DNA-binding IclR family transcriptional regulator
MHLREIAACADLDRGTVRRLLLTLMTEGIVVQETATGLYALGPAIRRLARSLGDDDLRQVVAPALRNLATNLGLTVFLSEYRAHQAICLDRHHDGKGMEVHFWAIGAPLHLNCGAAPKLLLAWQSDEEIALALARPVIALTPKSCVNRRALMSHLKLIRRRGWELAVDDVVVGLTALAVPLLDQADQLRGCISVSGLTPQFAVGANGEPIYLRRLLQLREELRPLLN